MLQKRNINPLLLTATAICIFLHWFPFYRRLHPDCEPVEKKNHHHQDWFAICCHSL